MPLSIRIISSPDSESISEWNRTFPENGGVIGRSYGSTLQLTDETRSISSTHAIIKKQSLGYFIQDTSTNGLYINGDKNSLGKGNQATLNDGDVLDVGPYRLLVSCFVPSKTENSNLIESNLHSDDVFLDDPFAQEKIYDDDESLDNLDDIHSIIFEKSNGEIEEDPFTTQSQQQNEETKEFDLNFTAIDDDPFREENFSSSFENINPSESNEVENNKENEVVIEQEIISESGTVTGSDLEIVGMTSEDVQKTQVGNNSEAELKTYPLVLYKSSEDKLKEQMEKAMNMALDRFLFELSPENLEELFNDLSTPTFFRRKIDYWSMYKKYFKRQFTNHDWQIKFNAYFQDAFISVKKLDGDE